MTKISTMRVIRIAIRSTCLSLFLGVFFTYEATAQVMPEYTCYIKYDHDAAGNRTAKYWYCCCGAETSGTPIDSVGSQKMVSSIPVLKELTFLLQPNPASTQLTVIVDQDLTRATIEINDWHGRRLRTGSLHGMSTQIDLHGLAQGSYTLRLMYGSEMLIKQFIVQ